MKIVLNDEKIFSKEDLLRCLRDFSSLDVETVFCHWVNGPTPGVDRPITRIKTKKAMCFS